MTGQNVKALVKESANAQMTQTIETNIILYEVGLI